MLTLIRRYLEAGVMVTGVVVKRYEGTPQGGPLSPLLANVLLDVVDQELERRGHAFVRYADDCNVYVESSALWTLTDGFVDDCARCSSLSAAAARSCFGSCGREACPNVLRRRPRTAVNGG